MSLVPDLLWGRVSEADIREAKDADCLCRRVSRESRMSVVKRVYSLERSESEFWALDSSEEVSERVLVR